MAATPTDFPQPTRTPANAPLLDAWQAGRLELQQCGDCAAKIFFPREHCPACWSAKLSWKSSDGRGAIVSFTRVHRQIHAAFANEGITVLAEIALDDGWRMIARVVTARPEAVASGMRVELLPMPDAARYSLPTFRPAE